MADYQALSSLEGALGVSSKALYTLSNRLHRHYRRVKIPKGNGEFRELSVPDDFLKAVQKKIARNLLSQEPISPFAQAYRPGSSIRKNALPHVGNPVLLKMDIRHFFDQIYYPVVKKQVFPPEKYGQANSVLLSLLCVYRDSLPQGAPTSPTISNIVMRDFDDTVGLWCKDRGIAYTRYCDDLTFSGDFDPEPVKQFVKAQLRQAGFFPNHRKTRVVRTGEKMTVTGVVVNAFPNVSATYRKKLRQELYYCQRWGVSSHMDRTGISGSPEAYLRQLLGRVNYVLSVNATDEEMKGYRIWLVKQLAHT